MGKGLGERAGWKPVGRAGCSLWGGGQSLWGTEKQQVEWTTSASLRAGVQQQGESEQPEVNEGGAGPVQLAFPVRALGARGGSAGL